MANIKKSVLVSCMDYRHGRGTNIEEALRDASGADYGFYRLTWPGGAGVLTDIDPDVRDVFVRNINIALDRLGAESVFLTVHGTSSSDTHGCGGFVLNGFGSAYETPEKSREFSADQLARAALLLRAKGITVPISTWYVTFDESGNVVEEIPV